MEIDKILAWVVVILAIIIGLNFIHFMLSFWNSTDEGYFDSLNLESECREVCSRMGLQYWNTWGNNECYCFNPLRKEVNCIYHITGNSCD